MASTPRPASKSTAGQALREALAQLRLRLLDLTGRNRLLNYRHPIGKSLQFVEAPFSALWERLSDGKTTVAIKGLPEPTRADWQMKHGRWSRPDPREWATRKGIATSYDLPDFGDAEKEPFLRAIMYRDDLAKHCRKIERESILAIEETGANMLYLVMGFLDFPDQKDSDRVFTAPLLCIPVVLSKKEFGGGQQFYVRYTGDDIGENLSLREKLRQDHGLILPELDEEEIHVEEYLANIKRLIKSRIGFELKRRVSLCLLSFTNMLLVRDLDPDNWPQKHEKNGLIDHPIIKTVLSGADGSHASPTSTAEEYPAEQEPALSIPLVFDADSSQHSALVDVLANRQNVVIEGPPGTGKSQTITNLIAASLAKGQRILFVSEKLAALQVVLNRLSIAGLDPFVLELHSTKTSKKQVLEQIAKRLEHRVAVPRELPHKLRELDTHRSELKAYADLLNSESNNRFGLTLHEVMWRAERHRRRISKGEALLTVTVVRDAGDIAALELTRRMQSLEHLSQQFLLIGRFTGDHPLWGFFPHPMVPGDDIRLQEVLAKGSELSLRLVADTEGLCTTVGLRVQLTKDNGVVARDTLAKFILETDEGLPLHLLAGLLAADGSGKLARRELEKVQSALELFHRLADAVHAGLIQERKASQELLAELRTLQNLRAEYGCLFVNAAEIQKLVTDLRAEIEHLTSACEAVQAACTQHAIPFDLTSERLKLIRATAAAVCDVPIDHLASQNERLTDPKCLGALEHLAVLQSKWLALEQELAQSFYLDHLPDDAQLTNAILTLRQGDAWFRVFQPSWRSAISLHKKLCKQQTRLRPSTRLNDLHRLVDFRKLWACWKSDLAWQQYLLISAPDEAFAFDPYLTLARWNRAILAAMETLGTDLFEPSSLNPSVARQLRKLFSDLRNDCDAASSSFQSIMALLPGLSVSARTISEVLQQAKKVVAILDRQVHFLLADAPSGATVAQVIAACEAALERTRLAALVEGNQRVRELLKEQFLGVNTDTARILTCLDVAQEIDKLPIPKEFRNTLLQRNAVLQGKQILALLDPVLRDFDDVDNFVKEMRAFGDFELETWLGRQPSDSLLQFACSFSQKTTSAAAHAGDAIPWSIYVARRTDVKELGLGQFLDFLETEQILPAELPDAYAYATFASIVREAFRQHPQLGKFSGLKHSKTREEFRRIDREIIQLRGKDVGARCLASSTPPSGSNGTRVDEKSEMVLLNHLIPQQRPRMPVRKMLSRAGRAVQALKPCFMMGPQAVAQYLTPGAVTFDLIVMDEASQLKPEEAIGSIARGAQLVVVGDPKQLPPTSFFTRMLQVAEDEDQFATTDMESILDLCLAHFHPPRPLRWHYRSQHHSLIAFSNHSFYRNLIVFPSPYGQSRKLGITATYLSDAVYEDQTNYKEAVRVVDAVVDHIKSRPDESLGVVTLNLRQRDLISELLEERFQTIPDAQRYREEWQSAAQPLFIKNLENVQGDERDAIVISTTFGKPSGAEAVRQNFGPISRQGGWRRLNVLFTRARRSVALFTSMRPEDILIDTTTPEGTKVLHNYLEYARSGVLETVEETGIGSESDFESSVMSFLIAQGYAVTPQLGVAGYRIDLAVKHPEHSGAYLAAIECDGASYHSALSVRDRDRIRQEILEAMGWRGRIWRIWSTDWFRMPRSEAEKLVSFLEELRKTWKPEHASAQSWVEVGGSKNQADADSNGANDLEKVRQTLLDFSDDHTVRVGDTVRYVDVKRPDDLLTVQITEDRTDTSAGLVHRGTPLAHTLLGAVAGDEVSMHLPGASTRVFRIIDVKRSQDSVPR